MRTTRMFAVVAVTALLAACEGDPAAPGAPVDSSAVGADTDASGGALPDGSGDAPDTSADSEHTTIDADTTGPDAAPVGDATPDAGVPDDAQDATQDSAADGGTADADAVEPDTADVQGPVLPSSIGGDRPAVVYVPDDYDPEKAWPIVVLLHGFSANGFVQNLYLGLSTRTTEDGFILVVPNGTQNPDGNLFWNATDYCCDFYGSGVDDVAYILSLIDEAAATFSVDDKRVYLIGHSNGGFMSYRMACDAPDRITALVSIAGATFGDEAKCEAATPVSVLQVHGTADDTITYAGSVAYPGAEETVSRWVTRDGCDSSEIAGDPLDIDDQVGGAETQVMKWAGCEAGTSVELWTMQDSGHIPAFPATFAERALAFLLAHTRE